MIADAAPSDLRDSLGASAMFIAGAVCAGAAFAAVASPPTDFDVRQRVSGRRE
jgi:hypothetical protein